MRLDAPVIGEYELLHRRPDGLLQSLLKHHNDLMVTWGYAAVQTLGLGNPNYRINRFYLEFENVNAAEDVVTPPSFDVYALRSYYANLTAPRDYLRVPLIGLPEVAIAAGFEDYFEAGQGNKLTFYGVTDADVGVNGLTFSDSVNSKLFGIALVAAPDDDDITKDIIVCRAYYPTEKQRIKPASGSLQVSYNLTFKPYA